jgi:hypothetical protein
MLTKLESSAFSLADGPGQAPANGSAGDATRESQSSTSNETFVKAAQEGINDLRVNDK